jgi:protein gp37
MAEDTKIEWADHTVNFWWGCTKVSPACANCYAERQDQHFHPGIPWRSRFQNELATAAHWGADAPRLLRVDAAAREAFKYQAKAVKEGRRFRIFTNSMSDFFEDRRDLDAARLEALEVIWQTPNLTWMILTKRPERILDLVARAQKLAQGVDQVFPGNETALTEWLGWWLCGKAPANVWLGTTVEDQVRADQRIPALLQVPAAVRFLSCEPMLGPVDLTRVSWPDKGEHRVDVLRFGYWSNGPLGFVNHSDMWDLYGHPIHWVIGGGESGPHARPCHPDWVRGLRDQCSAAEVPWLFKQWGEWAPDCLCHRSKGCRETSRPAPGRPGCMFHCGKSAAGRLLDGQIHDGYPEVTHG